MSKKDCQYHTESTPILHNETKTRELVQQDGCCHAISNTDGRDTNSANNMSTNDAKRWIDTSESCAPTPIHFEDLHTDDGDTGGKQDDLKLSGIPKQKKIILCLCTFANFLSATAFALLAPFFPQEAETKGLDTVMIGFVYGVYQLVVFLSSPLMGNFMIRAGVKFMFISGIFVGGCCAILFGVLNKGPDGTSFLVMCIAVRSVEAFGFAGFMGASMTIVSSEFRQHEATVLGILRAAVGAGNMVGPFLAGVLYEAGGFGLPFYCIGVPTLLNGLFIFNFLPPLQSEQVKHPEGRREKTILDLLRSPLVVVSLTSMFVSICCLQSFVSTFALFLEPFRLSPTVSGIMFVIGPVFYAASAPVWGYIADVKDKQAILIVSAHVFNSIGYWVLGNSPLLPFIPFSLWAVGIGFWMIGMTLSCLIVTPLKCMIYGACCELNYDKNPDTFAMVSGLYTSVYALGGFVGPMVGGVVVERYGHVYLFTGMGCIHVFMFFTTLGFFWFRHSFKTRKEKEGK